MPAARDMAWHRPSGSARRMAGLVLALALHLLFFAALMARHGAIVTPAGRADASAIVWIAPASQPVPRATLATAPVAARQGMPSKTPALSMPQAPVMRVIAAEPAPIRPASTMADDALSAETGAKVNADSKAAPSANDLSAVDQRSVGAAIKATLAENVVTPPHKNLMKARVLGRFEQFGADVQEASVPDCDKPDGLKLDPPVIPGTRIALKGLLALPHLAHAALTGRCR